MKDKKNEQSVQHRWSGILRFPIRNVFKSHKVQEVLEILGDFCQGDNGVVQFRFTTTENYDNLWTPGFVSLKMALDKKEKLYLHKFPKETCFTYFGFVNAHMPLVYSHHLFSSKCNGRLISTLLGNQLFGIWITKFH